MGASSKPCCLPLLPLSVLLPGRYNSAAYKICFKGYVSVGGTGPCVSQENILQYKRSQRLNGPPYIYVRFVCDSVASFKENIAQEKQRTTRFTEVMISFLSFQPLWCVSQRRGKVAMSRSQPVRYISVKRALQPCLTSE